MKNLWLNTLIGVTFLAIFGGCKSSGTGLTSETLENNGGGGSPPPIPESIHVECKLNVGGNFFNERKKTDVLCTVTGAGAIGWRVTVDGRQHNGWSGDLDPSKSSQQFQTLHDRVGGPDQKYEVYVGTRESGMKLYATLGEGSQPNPDGDIHLETRENECQLLIGGNVFRPKSHIECNVYGRGALRWWVEITKYDSNGNPRATTTQWQGVWNDNNAAAHRILTNKEEVGGSLVDYTLWVMDINGQRYQLKHWPARNDL